MPAHVATCGEMCPHSGPIAGGNTLLVKFVNYCLRHALTEYQVVFSTGSSVATVLNVGYTATSGECTTELTVRVPQVSLGELSTVTVTPNGVSSKAFEMEYNYRTDFHLEPAATQAVKNSVPTFVVAVHNLRDQAGALCDSNSCASSVVTVTYGTGSATGVLSAADHCTSGTCKGLTLTLPAGELFLCVLFLLIFLLQIKPVIPPMCLSLLSVVSTHFCAQISVLCW